MPTEDDYGRRQISSSQPQHPPTNTPSPSPLPSHCPAGCTPAKNPLGSDRVPSGVFGGDRAVFGSDRAPSGVFGSDRAPSGVFGSERAPSGVFGSDRASSGVFGGDRPGSDRLPSGERYQGVSERFPLGERPQTSVSADRLAGKEQQQQQQLQLQGSGYCQDDRPNYQSERYAFERSNCERFVERYQNLGSLDRYHHGHGAVDRYHRQATPTDRYEKDRAGDRYAGQVEKYQAEQEDATQVVFAAPDRRRTASKPEIFKSRDRERCEQYEHRFQQYYHDRYGYHHHHHHQQDRFPAIPCPERFATASEFGLEPPSPAPASDRFFPPPPLSPDDSPASDCFSNNAFPSPTEKAPPPERFSPPPPLSPSPTETYKRYHQGYASSRPSDHRYKDRYRTYDSQPYHANAHNNERYLPPTAHVPVERYVPEPYHQQYHGYKQYPPVGAASPLGAANGDPYMRRDLAFHYRLPLPYASGQYQRGRYSGHVGRPKCCQYQEHAKKLGEGYQLSKASPGSSSSSSLASQKDTSTVSLNNINRDHPNQCQNQNYPPKEYRCVGGYQCHPQQPAPHPPPSVPTPQPINPASVGVAPAPSCRHAAAPGGGPSVEYVGASGGRHVCATPPPPRGGVVGVGGAEAGLGVGEGCCARRTQGGVTVTVWRGPAQLTPPLQHHPQDSPSQQQQQQQPPMPLQKLPIQPTQRPPTPVAPDDRPPEPPRPEPPIRPSTDQAISVPPPRGVSLPPVVEGGARRPPARPLAYSQSERVGGGRGVASEVPPLERSVSRRGEAIKRYIRKETANFFGVGEEEESGEQQLRWLDRRKRMACRTMGPLKDEYCTPTISRFSQHRRTVSEAGPGRGAGPSSREAGQLATGRPDVLPGDSPDSTTGRILPAMAEAGTSLRRKDSVARMTWDGLSYVVTTLSRHRPRPRSQQSQWSRSFHSPETPELQATAAEEQSFFERPPSVPASPPEGDTVDRARVVEPVRRERDRVRYAVPVTRGWRREEEEEDVVLRRAGGSRKLSNWLDRVLDNSDRRQYGMGWVGKMFGRSIRKSVTQDSSIQEQLDDMEDHRPMFTYWVTTVQILVLFISIVCYGFGPFGLDLQARSGQVLVTSLSLQQVDYMEPANFWFGPRAGDLIHLGAKFAPCMRIDNKIKKEIDKIQAKERETACCIRNDDSGCVQSSQADCSKTISTWKKWTMGDAGPGGRISGSVCGLDPKFCDAPASVHPYEWPDDITKWPICRKTNTQFSKSNTQFSVQKGGSGNSAAGPRDKLAEHMVCEIIGHPCCIGIHGQCRITTKEYCDFVRGAFHEEASLCSQVSCLNDVCGMLPFYFPDSPDQFYRLWTSIFLHAGILQLVVTVLVQHFLMRDLEKLTGSLRIGIIYIGSGVAGNLASAIFVPYRADVGPAGSQFGLLACLIVEVLNAWPMLKRPKRALGKLLCVTLVLFLIGLLPWVDNYAHLFGFLFGFLLSYALLPFISFGPYDKHKKVFSIWVCLAAAWILFICLVLLFYVIPVYDCEVCSYFNCLPLTRNFCASQNINFKKEEPIV